MRKRTEEAWKRCPRCGKIENQVKAGYNCDELDKKERPEEERLESHNRSKTCRMVDAAPEAEVCCTDGYSGYLDVVFPGNHIFNIRNKNDTFTVEGVNADLHHYIPTLARRSRCFPRKLENLQSVLAVFVQTYNRFGRQKDRHSSRHPGTAVPFSLFNFF